jgi:transcriptional antiterminator RfaH
MPLLALEPFIFPDDVLDNSWIMEEAAGRWWVLHTRPRAEKSLARRLVRLNTPFFLPLYHRRWRSNGRQRDSYNPLFPGYLFLQGSAERLIEVLKTNLVARSLEVKDQLQLHEDLRRVYQLMSAGVPLAPEDQLLPGTWVEITSGPLAGLTGRFLRRGKQTRIFVEVQFLQRGVSVELEAWSVRPLDATC